MTCRILDQLPVESIPRHRSPRSISPAPFNRTRPPLAVSKHVVRLRAARRKRANPTPPPTTRQYKPAHHPRPPLTTLNHAHQPRPSTTHINHVVHAVPHPQAPMDPFLRLRFFPVRHPHSPRAPRRSHKAPSVSPLPLPLPHLPACTLHTTRHTAYGTRHTARPSLAPLTRCNAMPCMRAMLPCVASRRPSPSRQPAPARRRLARSGPVQLPARCDILTCHDIQSLAFRHGGSPIS